MYLCICVSVCSHVYCAMYLWLPKDNLRKFILSFNQMGPGDQTLAIRLGGRYFTC